MPLLVCSRSDAGHMGAVAGEIGARIAILDGIENRSAVPEIPADGIVFYSGEDTRKQLLCPTGLRVAPQIGR